MTSPRPAPGTDTPITVFSNIPNPYNDRLFAALRAHGVRVTAVYKHAPSAEGRTWPVDLHPDDCIVTSLTDEARAWHRSAGTHVVLTGSYASATDVARRVLASPRALTVHVWGERLRPNTIVVRLARRAYFAPLRLDGILAVGSRAVPTYAVVVGRRPGRPPIHTFPYTTDRGLSVPAAPAPRPTIGFAGRLLPHKGVDVVLRALRALPADERPRFEVAGDGPAAAALRQEAAQLGIAGAVEWLGALAPDALDERRATWWAQVVPSQRSEGWGVVVPEALNSGVPVVATAHVNAAHDLVRDGLDGVVLPAARGADPEAWADALHGVLADEPARTAMAADARVVGAAFGVEPAAAFLLDVLRRAARRRRGDGLGGEAPPARSFIDEGWQRVAAGEGDRR